MEGFGARLVAAREKLGISQKKLAELLQITPTRLNYWEKDKREPDFYMFRKIVTILDTDANELLGLKIKQPYDVGKLNDIGIQKVYEYIEDLSTNPKYTESTKSTGSAVSDFDAATDVTQFFTRRINKTDTYHD